jgi:hypothetical protein
MILELIKGNQIEQIIGKILSKIHVQGPVDLDDLETLSFIKKYYPVKFSEYEGRLINLMGLFYKSGEAKNLTEAIYQIFANAIKSTYKKTFTPFQADAYKRISNQKYFSFSAPTSAGKSYLFREILSEIDGDTIIIVPSRALISEYVNELYDIFKDDKSVLILQFIEVINVLHTTKRIFVITPERGAELFKNLSNLNVKLFLFDEAQMSEDGIRGMKFDAFVRRVSDEVPTAKKVFTHPFVDNPEAQLIKHKFDQDSDYKRYSYNAVGKIFISRNQDHFYYFSPFKRVHGINTEEDIVEKTLKDDGTVLIYISKKKIYEYDFLITYDKYIKQCPIITNPEAIKAISKLKEFIGASQDRHSIMIDMMHKGIVIHHGSMPLKARILIEDFVNAGFARICFSTSTLIQGINMPFDVVWVNNFKFDGATEERKVLELKNLIGRAGRSTNRINNFDYGYVIIEEANRKTFVSRLNDSSVLSETSMLDSEALDVGEDAKDIIEAIKDKTFDDTLQLTVSQVERLKKSDLDEDLKFILDKLVVNLKTITASQYYRIEEDDRKKLKECFKNVFISHLRRDILKPAESKILSTAIPILLWQIQGKSFAEIVKLRYNFLTEKKYRDQLKNKIKMNEISSEELAEELKERFVRYSAIAAPIPNIKVTTAALYPNTSILNAEYDILVYDTYDYLDKVLSQSLKDPFSAALLIYFQKTKDVRALILSNCIKYGTNDPKEIWLVRYGFSFDDIDWLVDYVERVDEKEIVFRPTINDLDEERFNVISRFVN